MCVEKEKRCNEVSSPIAKCCIITNVIHTHSMPWNSIPLCHPAVSYSYSCIPFLFLHFFILFFPFNSDLNLRVHSTLFTKYVDFIYLYLFQFFFLRVFISIYLFSLSFHFCTSFNYLTEQLALHNNRKRVAFI